MSGVRAPLFNRRSAEIFDFLYPEKTGRRWICTVGRYPDGSVAEIFLDATKTHPMSDIARAEAIVVSQALQYGVPLKKIKDSIRDRKASPLTTALAMIE